MSLSLTSSIMDVQQFLIDEYFDEDIRIKFIKFNGKALLGSDKDTIVRRCGDDEGERLYSLLNTLRSQSQSKFNFYSYIYLIESYSESRCHNYYYTFK